MAETVFVGSPVTREQVLVHGNESMYLFVQVCMHIHVHVQMYTCTHVIYTDTVVLVGVKLCRDTLSQLSQDGLTCY